MSLVGDAAEKLAITTSWTNPQVCRTARTVDWHELATKDDLAGLEGRVNARFDAVGDRIDTGLADLRGEMKLDMARLTRDMARRTYVILAGLAAIITPIYFALFSGAAG